MSLKNVYRSLMVTGVSASVLFAVACSNPDRHVSASKEGLQHWHMAQLAIQYQLAQQQYAVGDYDKCRETLKDAFAMNEPHAGLQMLAGKVDIEKGDLDSAATHLKESIRIKPGEPEPYYLLGVIYQRWQKLEVAEDYYQQAWDHNANEARYMLAMVEMKITRGDLEDARKTLEDKLTYFEQNAALRAALARIAAIKGDFVTASRYYRDAYLLSSDDDNIKRSYAESLFFAGRYADAAPLLDALRAPTKGPDGNMVDRDDADLASLSLMLGQAYLNLHRSMEARACYQDVIKTNPDNAQALLGLSKACIDTNELPAALSTGKRVLRMDPSNVEAMILVAMIQQKQKNWSEAFTTLEVATAQAPKDSTIMCMQGLSMLKIGKRDMAQNYFEKALAVNPNDSWATELLAQVKPAPISAVTPDAAAKTDEPKVADAKTPGSNASAAADANTTTAPAESPQETAKAEEPRNSETRGTITNAAPSGRGVDAP